MLGKHGAQIAVALVILAGVSRALATPRRVLVERVVGVEGVSSLKHSIEDAVLGELGQRQGLVVVSPAELEQALAFARERGELGCDDLERCVSQVQAQLHADAVLTARLGRIADHWVLTLAEMDRQRGVPLRRSAVEGATPEALIRGVPELVSELLGAASAPTDPLFHLGEPLRLAIMPLSANGVPASTAAAMTEILANEYSQLPGVSVLSREDIEAMLRQIETSALAGCDSDLHCVAQIAAELGLRQLVTGSVSQTGSTHVLSLRWVDTKRTEVIRRVVEVYEGDASELRHAIKVAGLRLIGQTTSGKRTGNVDWTFNVPRGTATLDSQQFPFTAHTLRLSSVATGRHSLRVDPLGTAEYLPLQTDVYVAPGLDHTRTFSLQESPGRWYKRSWVWALAGAIAVGAVAVGGLLATGQAGSRPGSVLETRVPAARPAMP